MRQDTSLHLAEGYCVEEDAEILTLRRLDGTTVAYFSTQGASKEAIEQAAEEDRRNLKKGNMSREEAPSSETELPIPEILGNSGAEVASDFTRWHHTDGRPEGVGCSSHGVCTRDS